MDEPADNYISVDVDTRYLEDQSDPSESRYVFAYTITIRNRGTVPAKLLSRHWLITDADGKVQEVRGEGVVGAQPVLRPGEEFEYTSWCVIATSSGSMRGSYQMITPNGDRFDADIAPFKLSLPERPN